MRFYLSTTELPRSFFNPVLWPSFLQIFLPVVITQAITNAGKIFEIESINFQGNMQPPYLWKSLEQAASRLGREKRC